MSEERLVLEKVHIKPIVRENWLPKGHDGEIRYTACYEQLMPVVDHSSRAYVTGLTEKEATLLEKELRLQPGTLSPYNEEYWSDHRKGARFTSEGLVLNPNFPEDKIKLSWLMVHPRVAKSEDEKFDDPDYEYVATSQVQEATVKNKKRSMLKDAYKKLWELSLEEKTDVLRLYGKKVTKETSAELIDDSINTLIEENPKDFIDIVEDPDFKTKILIKEAVQCKALILEGSKYKLIGGDVIAHDIDALVEYINDPQNAVTKKQLIAKVKLANSK